MIKLLIIEDKQLPYVIIKSKNKNTYIRMKKDYVEVSKSKYINDQSVIDILTNNFNKYYNKFNSVKSSIPNENEVILEGIKYEINLIKKRTFNYEIKDNIIYISTLKTDLIAIKKQLYKEHLNKMLLLIDSKVKETLFVNKIKERPISISYFKTKFGSYHRISDSIKLNMVLAKVEIKFLFYVLMHEYAHTVEFNHSKNFYKTLEQLMPDYKYYDKTLKKISILI